MHLIRRLSASLGAAFAAAAFTVSAQAAITPVGPFTGTNSETFESFSNYYDGNFYEPNGTLVFGGAATMSASNSDLVIYQPGYAPFGLGSAAAQVSDGTKGLGLNSVSDTVTFVFATAINSFGGYFGAAYGGGFDGNISFGFSDGSTAAYTYNGGESGALVWQGWTSSVAITSATVSGSYVVMDGLQVNSTASVPDGGATLPMLGGAFALLALIRRKR